MPTTKKSSILPILLLLFTALFLTGCAGRTQADAVPTPSPEPTVTTVPTHTPVPTCTPTLTGTPAPDFFRVSGTDIVDSNGNPVQLKGIAMGNMIWSSLIPVDNDHTEDSFRELAELGFNCVRFYLSYSYFESDNNPYVYKESGFAWLDQNIAWAKKYNIRLILNMHAPQGGYQSLGEGLALWQNKENQKRLISLWTEIAERYANEETIIGYGLINEPVVPLLTDFSSTTAQCSSLMQRIADSIRTVDNNHILFAERLCAAIDASTGIADWSLTYDDVLFLIDDDNTAYEFHCYSPHQFTHQNMDWAGTGGNITTYPSNEAIFKNVISYWTGCNPAKLAKTLEDGWYLFESDFSTLSEIGNAGSVALQAANTGIGGTVLFDDIIIEEYKNGNFNRIITSLDFETVEETDDFYFWSEDRSGYYCYLDLGYQNSRCVALCDLTSDANIAGYRFPLLDGYEYKIRGKMKYVSTDSSCYACPRIDYSLFEAITFRDINYLESELIPYIEFGQKNQVPIFLGEFGVCYPAWESNVGAAQWVTDMLTLCQKYNLHFNYHAYHDYWFGLYRLPMDDPNSEINEELADIFKKMLN